jgi:hypothetical protein
MNAEIILYTSPEGNKRVAVYYQGETVWLTQKQMADLLDLLQKYFRVFRSGDFSRSYLAMQRLKSLLQERFLSYARGLFDVDVRTISDHLQTIFQTGELSQESVIRKIRITA